MQNYLQEESTTLQNSLDFLDRFSEWPPEYKNATQPPTNLVRAAFDTEVITDLAAKAKMGATFHLGFALPHTNEAAAESAAIAHANTIRDLQIAQGESPANLRRVNTKNICTPVIVNEFALLAFCSNIITILSTLVKFTTTSLNPDEVPLLARCARAFGAVIMSGDFKEYRSKRKDTHAFQYYIFNALDKIWGTAAKALRDEKAIKAAFATNCDTRAHEISARHSNVIEGILSDSLDALSAAMSDTVEIPEVNVYKKSPFGPEIAKATADAEAKARRARIIDPPNFDTPKKKIKTERVENLQGAIVVTAKPGKQANISMPDDWPEEEEKPCLANMKFKGRGCQNFISGKCRFSHKSPLEWCFAAFDSMNRKIKSADNGMAWNPLVVKPSDISLKYSNNSAAPAADRV